MIRRAAFLALAVVSVPVGAQSVRPAKLMVFKGDGVAITDYPSMARCEAARAHIAALVDRLNANRRVEQLPGGGTITSLPVIIETMCIPG